MERTKAQGSPAVNEKAAAGRLRNRLGEIAEKPGAELSGLALAVVRKDSVVFEDYRGRRYIDPDDPARDLPVTADTKFRIASISKPVVGLLSVLAAEDGLLDLDRDVSDYLGFPLRNPNFPDTPITAAHLLTHTSSLRDGERNSIPLGYPLRDFFEPGGQGWEDGVHFAASRPDGERSPGRYFCYCNLGFGVLGTALEALHGERFDLLARRRVLGPLGLDASFNVNLLSDSAFRNLAVLYRKMDARNVWDPRGAWMPQVDDYRGKKPPVACPLAPGLGPLDLEAYAPGTNGTLFAPQGGLRASVRDLGVLARLFLNGGEVDGVRLLRPGALERMTAPRWTWDPMTRNGEIYNGVTRESGLALMRTTDSHDEFGGDRLRSSGGTRMFGHHGDAYGLLGGWLFHPRDGYAFAYLLGGTAADPEILRGRHSSFFLWEEEIQEAVLDYLEA